MTDVVKQAAYRPFGSWLDPVAAAGLRSHRELNIGAGWTILRAGARPQLFGLRSRNLEILTDALLRKHPGLLGGSDSKARALLLRRFQHHPAQLRGIMAEAIFLDRNPQWGYVRKPNASQHDVYRWVRGRRPPLNGQIKFVNSGDPGRYAAAMVKDHRAQMVFIPDDHVKATREYLGARQKWRDFGRVKGIGKTSAEIRSATEDAARGVAREKYAAYMSFGVASAMWLGPLVYEVARGNFSANLALNRGVRSLSLSVVGMGTDRLLARIAQGAMRGTIRGQAIVAGAIGIAELAWLLHDHGWQRSFSQAAFYESAAGSVSGLTLGTAGFLAGMALAAPSGPFAPLVGVGVSAVSGAVGYFGGKTVARAVMELVAPEMLIAQERQRINDTRARLNRNIAELQGLTSVALN